MTDGQHTYWLDFAVLWALFAVAMVICRSLTAAFSKTRMRFKYPIDPVGGPLVGFIAAWVLASFTLATLHVSPMPKDILGGKLAYTSADSASPISQPDAAWLSLSRRSATLTHLGASSTGRFSANGLLRSMATAAKSFKRRPA